MVLKKAATSLLQALGNAARRAIPFVSSDDNDDDDAKIIDGKRIAADIRAEIKEEVERLKAKTGKVPGLAVVIVGSSLSFSLSLFSLPLLKEASKTFIYISKRERKAALFFFGTTLTGKKKKKTKKKKRWF